MRTTVLLLLALTTANACVGDSTTNDAGPSDATTNDVADGSYDASDATSNSDAVSDAKTNCDPTKPFGTPVLLAGFNSTSVASPRLSPDELTLFLGGTGGQFTDASTSSGVFVATRTKTTSPFNTPTRLVLSANGYEFDPSISSDGLTLFFTVNNVYDRLWVGTRTSTLSNFGNVSALGTPPASAVASDGDAQPFVTVDGAELWLGSSRSGGVGQWDIYASTISGSTFGTPVNATALNSISNDWYPVLSADRLTIYFASDRAGSAGAFDIWVAHRTAVTDAFLSPTNAAELNTTVYDMPGWLSPDNCRLYLGSDRGGTGAVYVAERSP